MKKILGMFAGLAMLAACSEPYETTQTSLSNPNNPSNNTWTAMVTVPTNIQSDFSVLYPAATNVVWYSYDQTTVPVDWELLGWTTLDASDYAVRFDLENEHYYGWYDSDGTWIGSAYIISDIKTLPMAVNNTLNSQFPAYTLTSVKRNYWKDHMAYELELKNGDSKVKALIDANGTILKQKTKMK